MSLDWCHDWICAALPDYGADNVFRAKQSNIIPSSEFVTYQALSLDTSGFETLSDGDLYADPGVTPEVLGTFTRTHQQNCLMQLQIACYSPNAALDLQTVISYARSDTAIAIFDAAYVSFIGASAARNMAFLADNQYLDRWQITVDFMYSATRIEALNAILEWEIAEEFETDGIEDPIAAVLTA